MTNNKATIFSNGIADFRRCYNVTQDAATEISIPVKREYIADVLGSLNVYGHVALKAPPSFRPANELEGSLELRPDCVIEDLAERLSGVKVEVSKADGSVTGTLVGLHCESEGTAGDPVERKFLVVMIDQGFQKIPLREMEQLRFLDRSVQTEIDKALQRNFGRIKPHSTFVDLKVTTEQDEAEAIIQYTIPAAAWKISYRLRQDRVGLFEFQGFAIVDNNTDEDWNDFHISVVTGEPVTFSTDLADSKMPKRRHVNVVKEVALGAVEVEETEFDVDDDVFNASFDPSELAPTPPIRNRRGIALSAQRTRAADTEDADVHEIGDFCVFESKTPVTIEANRSAVIPVFHTILQDAKTVLHYRHENHAERPYRSVQFTNETSYSLGRGICSVFEGGTFAGSCIMPATKPAGESLLPHALETGVRVRRELNRHRKRLVGLRLSEGFGYSSMRESQSTVYRLKNNRDESFLMVLDHDFCLRQPQVKCCREDTDGRVELSVDASLKNGIRLRLNLEAGDQIAIVIDETRLEQTSVQIAGQDSNGKIDLPWLREHVLQDNGPLADHPGVRSCLDIQERLDAKQAEITRAIAGIDRLAARQERLRKNISTGGHDEQTSRWKTDLGKAEESLFEMEENTIPRLRAEEASLADEMRAAIFALAAEWSADR